jgi:hypothetical protein
MAEHCILRIHSDIQRYIHRAYIVETYKVVHMHRCMQKFIPLSYAALHFIVRDTTRHRNVGFHVTHAHPCTQTHIHTYTALITYKNVFVCMLLYTYGLKLNGINYITLHHITSRYTSYIDTKNNANRGTCIHRSVHACTLAYTHKCSPLSYMALPLSFLFALQRTASIHTYIHTHTSIHTCMHAYIHKDRQTASQPGGQAGRQTQMSA